MAKTHKFEGGFNPLDEIKERINKKEIQGNMIIDIKKIITDEQPRTTFKDIKELSASIRQFGILVPLLVQPLPDLNYKLIAGERRYRAAKQIGLKEVPVICDTMYNLHDVFLIQIIENIQRQDLNPLELAHSFQKLKTDYKYSSLEVANKIGKTKRYVNEILKILDLKGEDAEKIKAGEAYTNFTRKNNSEAVKENNEINTDKLELHGEPQGDEAEANLKSEVSDNPCSCQYGSCDKSTADKIRGNIISKFAVFNLTHETIKIKPYFNVDSEYFIKSVKAEIYFYNCFTADTFINYINGHKAK